jgi:dynein heavy chain 1
VSGESVCLPEGNKHSDALRWINSLPDDQPPTWLGLSSNAELVLSITHSKKVITDLQQIQEVVDVGDEEDLETHTGEDEVEALPAWLRSLGPLVDAWLSRLPTQPQLPSESRTNPVARFLDREMRFGVHLYTMVSQNLSEVAELCKGVKSPQSIRDIALQLSKGLVPTPWRLYASIDYSMSTWLPNLVQRLEQLTRLSNNVDAVASMGVWLGGLFSPEAFVTATRQVTAQKHSWALEQLELQVQLGDDTLDEDCFTICDLNLENASISGSQIEPSDVVTTVIPKSIFRWVQQDQTQTNKVSLPVYLDSSRKNLLLTIGVEVTDSKSAYNRGLAIVASL